MPGLDRTGPLGEGPRTGGGFGLCGPGRGAWAGGGRWYAPRGAGRGLPPWGGGRGRVWGGGRGYWGAGRGAWNRGRWGGFWGWSSWGGPGYGRRLGAWPGRWAGAWGWAWPWAPYGHEAYEEPTKESEMEYLRNVLADMEKEMKAVQERIKELEEKNEK